MGKRIFKLPTPQNRRTSTPEKPAFFKHGEGLRIARLRNSERWRRLRELVLSENPLCAICQRPAEEAHHVKDAARHEDLFFEQSNLVGLCEECHVKIHSADRRGITIDVLFPNLR